MNDNTFEQKNWINKYIYILTIASKIQKNYIYCKLFRCIQ